MAVTGRLIEDIGPNDTMFNGDREHYFAAGRSGLRAVLLSLETAGIAPDDIVDILDFGCGHGRVLRHLRARFPEANLSVCDFDAEGAAFCARHFDARVIDGAAGLDDWPGRHEFDLIWVGSVFTHLPREDWLGLFETLFRCTRKGGLMVFTTAGRKVLRLIAEGELGGLSEREADGLRRAAGLTGIGYGQYPDTPRYGRTVALPRFVTALIERYDDAHLVLHAEAFWGVKKRQDLYAVSRVG